MKKFLHINLRGRLLTGFLPVCLSFAAFIFSVPVFAQEKQQQELPTLGRSLQVDAMYYDAVRARLKGDDKEAESLLEQVVKIKPESAGAYYDLARINMKQNKTDKAAEYIKKAIALEDTNPWYKSQYAEILLMGNKFDEAAVVFDKLAKQEKYNEEYLEKSAMLYMHAGKYKEALDAIDKMLEKQGEDEELLLRKQQIYLKMNELDKAVKVVERLIEKNPNEGKYYAILAQMYASNDKPAKAEEVFKKAEKQFPDDPAVQLGLADYYKKLKNEDKYHEYVKKAILNKALDAEAQLVLLGPYLQELTADTARRKDAMQLAKEIAVLHKDNPRVAAVYGDVLYLNNERTQAREQYKRAVEIDPSIYMAWRNLLYAYTDKKDADSLLEYSDKALQNFPNQAELHYLKGVGYFNKKDYPNAIKSLNRAIDMQPEDNLEQLVRMHTMLGDVYNMTKQYELSDSSFNRALRLDGKDATVLNNYAYYLALRGVRLADAEKMSKLSLEIRPGEATFLDTYGWVLYKQGKYEQAGEQIQKAIEAAPEGGDGTVWEHMGDIMYKLKDVDKAVECWKKAKEKGTDNQDIDKKIRDRKLYE